MKKSLLLFVFSFVALFAIAQTVYITKTGLKYHSDGCRYLSHSCIPISLSEAVTDTNPAVYVILQRRNTSMYIKSMLLSQRER